MSLEQSLERIAIALEKIAGKSTPTTTTVVNMASDTPTAKPEVLEAAKPAAKAKATPAAKTVTPESLAAGPVAPAAKPAEAKPTHTLADVLDLLKKAAVKHGAPKIKQLMIDHGADAKMPKVETIPAANYPALVSVVKSLDTPTEEKEGIF